MVLVAQTFDHLIEFRSGRLRETQTITNAQPLVQLSLQPQEIDPFYLFACHMQWERDEDPSAAWELLSAARSSHPDTRAHARALLSSSRHLSGMGQASASEYSPQQKRTSAAEISMNAPYDLEIIDICQQANLARDEQIVAVPTLIKRLPRPLRRLIGDLSDQNKVLFGLDLKIRE